VTSQSRTLLSTAFHWSPARLAPACSESARKESARSEHLTH